MNAGSWLFTVLKTRDTCVVSPQQDVYFSCCLLLYFHCVHVCHGAYVVVRGQLTEGGFPLPPYWSQVSKGHQAWQQHLYPLNHLGGSKEGTYTPTQGPGNTKEEVWKEREGRQTGKGWEDAVSWTQPSHCKQELTEAALGLSKSGLVNIQPKMGEGITGALPNPP